MYRLHKSLIEVFLLLRGGPFFKNKDEGAWTIPKGIPGKDEELQSLFENSVKKQASR